VKLIPKELFMSEPEKVRLKTGVEENLVIVERIMKALEELKEEDPLAFYEFVMACRENGRALFSREIATTLMNRELFSAIDGMTLVPEIHDSVRAIVISGVEGKLDWMRLVDPRMTD
jgi:hypothetical protein